MMFAHLDIELGHAPDLHVVECPRDPLAQDAQVGERLRLDVEDRDARLVDVEQLARSR